MTRQKTELLITLNSFWTNGTGMSGGDQIAKQVFARIATHFNRIAILTSCFGFGLFKDLTNAHHLKLSNITESKSLGLAYLFRTIEGSIKILSQSADIIYTGSDFFPDVLPSFIYKVTHPNVIWHQAVFHIYPDWKTRPGSKWKSFLGYYLQRLSLLLIKKSDNVICINHGVRNELIKRGFAHKQLTLIYPGINNFMLSNLKPHSRKYDATFLARLNPSKGVLDLPKIWRSVCEDFPDAKLAIIGSGGKEITEQLNKEISERGLSGSINILGYLEDEEAYGLIKSSGVFIFPSHEEGFGIAVAEAMACGVPVVAWDLKVYSEIFENKFIKVKENDFKLFAREILSVLKDKTLHDKMVKEGLEYIKKYSWDNVAQQYLACLTQN